MKRAQLSLPRARLAMPKTKHTFKENVEHEVYVLEKLAKMHPGHMFSKYYISAAETIKQLLQLLEKLDGIPE
jgi:hypothetical protein